MSSRRRRHEHGGLAGDLGERNPWVREARHALEDAARWAWLVAAAAAGVEAKIRPGQPRKRRLAGPVSKALRQ
jgi:hypothetical protein